ncbi:hypothetical protein F4679DRAFT_520938 [Xylaria curta]|nr:hypothetical protein F4679DRAFT_520938 [Xylaria curta]
MDTEAESGSQSTPKKLEGCSEITVPTIDNSHVGHSSSNSKASSDYKAKPIDNNIKIELLQGNTETDEAIAKKNIQDSLKHSSAEKPARSNESMPKDKSSRKTPGTANADSESDEYESDESDDSDVFGESDDGSRGNKDAWRKCDQKLLHATYRVSSMVRHKSGKKSMRKGMNFIAGLMDYLRVLEKRMDKLEDNISMDSARKQQEMDTSPSPKDADESTVFDVRFCNLVNHLKEDGGHPKAHDGIQRDACMCNRAKYLIQVLYSWLSEEMGMPSDTSVSESPHASDIDIIAFCVQSEPITEFFEWELRIGLDSSRTLRFRKPFKGVIRNISRIKEQLLKLENNFGSMTESVQQSQPNTAEPKADHEESPLSFDKPAALPHFQSFVAFVDKYLGKHVKLFNRLREAKEERVAFENLWMLFDSRKTIYCPLREVGQDEKIQMYGSPIHQPIRRHTPQAYRVISTIGGALWTELLTSSKKKKSVKTSLAPTNVDLPDLPILSEDIPPAVPISTTVRSSYNHLEILCFYIEFNGLTYGAVPEVFVFKPYEGELDIRSLQVYPIEYATDHTLSDRGKSFLQLTRVSHKQYEGLTTGPNREEINSPVIVDIKHAFVGDGDLGARFIEVPKLSSPSNIWLERPYEDTYEVMGKSSCSNPWCFDASCAGNVFKESSDRGRYGFITETRLVLENYETLKQRGSAGRKHFRHIMEDMDMVRLLPGTVPGFALRNRKWALLDINLLQEVEQNSEWENLFLPHGHQELVQALVGTHTSDKEGTKGMDLVRGKGKGCIVLLHGVPGVGKTSTAECVAAHTKKPLYPITCGDIGYYAEDVERNMETHFKLAHRWGCVLLLDEADVFLAKRDQKDVQRNGLVSVFLRILEYYSGILFLTTNRVGAIDDAFRSRLHLTLYYPKLTKKQTNDIFTNNFARIANMNEERKKKELPPFEYTDTEDEILNWAKKNYKILGWNGRQIRNAFQSVLALSEFQARGKKNKSKNPDKQANPVVKLRYFKVVANTTTQFNEYLKATHGYNEERVAKRDFIRAVEFSPKSNSFLTETEDSSDQDSDERDNSSESDPDKSRKKEDQDQSDDSDSDHGKNKKRKSKAKPKKESSSKTVTKKGKKVKDDSVKFEKSKDKKKKDKEEEEDTDDSE